MGCLENQGKQCPQRLSGWDFEVCRLLLAQMRLNADTGALSACLVGWYYEALARRAKRRCYLAQRVELHGVRRQFGRDCDGVKSMGAMHLTLSISRKPLDACSDQDLFC